VQKQCFIRASAYWRAALALKESWQLLKECIMKAIMTKFYALVLALALGVLPRAGMSEDIDLFQGNPAITGQKPNVLIILDNTANWNTPFDYEKAALVATVNALDDRFNVGVMMFAETGSPNDNTDGGYVRATIRNMNGTNKTALANLVNNLRKDYDKGNKATYAQAMHEAYLYFSGSTARAGLGRYKRDFAGNLLPITGNNANDNPYLAYSNVVYALLGNAFASGSNSSPYGNGTYVSPITAANNCAKNYIIFISNGPADNSDDGPAATLLTGLGGNTSAIPISPSGEQSNLMDEYARFLYGTDVNSSITGKQNIITYTVDVNPLTSGQGPDHTALLKSAANQGHGRYFFGSDVDTLTNALKTIFNEIQAVDSVFAAVSLPVTVNVRGSYLNQVYMGVFRPDADASPRWPGNLKQYKVGYDASTFTGRLEDKNSQPIENSSTGFINPDVVSFWTTLSTFWNFSPSGTPASGSDSPDGAIVEKGGAGQRLRTVYATDQSTRNLYTTAGLAANAALSGSLFATTNTAISGCDLGIVGPVSASISRSATTATVTYTAPTGCNFSNGQTVTFSGASDSAYNGTRIVSNVTAGSFTFTVLTTPASPDQGSSITASDASSTTIGISSISSTNATPTTITINTSAPHGLTAPAPNITISGTTEANFNGISCAPTIVTASQLTCTYCGATGSCAQKNKSATGGTIAFTTTNNKAITSLTRTEPTSGSTAVATATASAAHGFAAGSSVTISGASGIEYNNTFIITSVPTTTSFTFNVTVNPAVSATASVSGGSTTKDNLINWVRGQDNAVDENLDGLKTDIRASAHGDVLHSRPAVVNYGRTADNRDIVVYYGANDGVFHAVKGGREDADGYEKWGVVFPEFFNKLDRLRSQQPSTSSTSPKPYFADGPVGVYVKDADSNNKLADAGDIVNLYIGMRRGGRFIYALDVNNPDAPKFLWKKSNSNNDSDGDFRELGQTWSEPKAGKLDVASGVTDPVIIFGAGYDPEHEDTLPATTNDKGRGVFILNAITGALVKQFGSADGMTCSFPADVVALDRDADGHLDRIYAGDTCGNLWRMDISGAQAGWNAYKIAAIGGSTKTGTDARKFLNAPSVVFGTSFDAILIGTGDREHPFDMNIQNYFYMFKDTNTGLTGSATGITAECSETSANLYDASLNKIQAGTTTQTAAQAALDAAKGWCIKLDEGEKVVGNAATLLGTTFFGTNLPSELSDEDIQQCKSNLGEARLYSISYKDASIPLAYNPLTGLYVAISAVRYEVREGGGFPPSPVPVQTVTDDGKVVTGVISGPKLLQPSGTGRRSRVYWNIEME
jgi:Tfp pilus tip-associated adhesin PilY1